MSLNSTPSAERVHIAFFGVRNAGKSSLVNAVTGQSLAVVSDVKGTTTDPVTKAMELLPVGPVVIIDTPGIDDEGDLGSLRVQKTRDILRKTDVAVLVVDAVTGLSPTDSELTEAFKSRSLPFVIVYNKADLLTERKTLSDGEIYVSALTGENIYELKELIASLAKKGESEKRIVADLLSPGDVVVLVVPIDESAPKGRLILPQQQTMRDILDFGGVFITCQPEELSLTLDSLSVRPKLVITDSQAFSRVSKIVPDDIYLTSFSILFARYKGELNTLVSRSESLSDLKEGDTVLISEGCTHHRQCGDIGTVKMPRWIENYTGKKLNFVFTSGGEFPADLSQFSLIVHCGGCMLNEKEMKYRMEEARRQGVPMLNYGAVIAKTNGIFDRSLKIFKDLHYI